METATHQDASRSRLLATHWTAALGYVGFIYATLGIVPAPLAFLRSHGILRLTLAALFACCVVAVLGLLASRSRQAWRFAALAGVGFVYALAARRVTSPEEQIHFIQYGLVGVLFVRALRISIRRDPAAYAAAFFLAVAAGWIDELLQGRLPNRHYDVRDVALNAISAALGLLVYRLIPPKRPTP